MDDTGLPPAPVVPPTKAAAPAPNMEMVLSQQANAAIKAGADPKAVSDALGQMVTHLRSNPDVAKQGSAAIAAGADPGKVSAQLASMASAPKPQQPAPEGLGSRVLDNVGGALKQIVTHPIDTIHSLVTAPIESAVDSFFTPVEGEKRAQSDYLRGKGVDLTPDVPYGGTYTKSNSPVIQSRAHMLQAQAQTLANVAAPGIMKGVGSAVAGKIGAGAISRAAGLAASAAPVGAAYDPSDPVAGGLSAAIMAPALDAAGRGVGNVAGKAGSGLLDATGFRPNDTGQITVPVLGKFGPTIQSGGDRAASRASQAISKRAGMDAASGFVAPQGHPSLPSMPLDQAGPNVEGLAEGIANRPGPGRAIIQNAVESRAAGMRPAISGELDNATGATAADGENLLRQLHAEHEAQASATNVVKAVGTDAANAKPDVQTPNIADVWQQTVGGTHPNGIALLRQMADAQKAEGDQLFGHAREATAGQVVDSPTLNQFADTPVGKLAFGWAKMQKSNRLSPIPMGTETVLPPGMQKLLDDARPEHQAKLLADFKNTGAVSDAPREMMDPEMLHYAKQYTAKIARMGVNDGAQGTIATQAQGAMPLFDAIKREMPEEWQAADAAWSKHARTMDALNAGRNILRTQVNPAGAGKRPLFNSLDALEQKAPTLPPEQAHALQIGAQSAISDMLKGGTGAKQFAAQLADPASPASRRVALALGDQSAPQRLAQRLQPTTNPQQLLAPPPEQPLSTEGQGASLGLDVFKHKISPPSGSPDRSLAVLGERASSLPPEGKITMQQGAAQAARGEWDRTGRSVKSPGRVFDFSSPERAQQLRYAFQSPEKMADFQQAVGAWDHAQAQQERILGNSRTGLRGAEGSGMAPIAGSAIMGGVKSALKAVLKKAGGAALAASSQAFDAEVAKILVNPELRSLPPAERAAQIHQRILQALPKANLIGAINSPPATQRP